MRSRHRVRTAADVVRGLGALLLIAILLVGIPDGLLAVAGPPPLPSAVPNLDELVAAITRPDDGTLLVAALTWAGWVGWATLALSVVVEIPAALRGVRAPRLPALGPQQRIAAGLVAAAALLFTAPTSLATTTAAQAAHATQTAEAGLVATAPAAPGSSADDVGDAAEESSRVHVVEPGDTLWDIADTYLGDGLRYPELFEASKDTTQPDGRHLTDPDLIHIGWEITIPVDDDPAGDETTSGDGAADSAQGDEADTPEPREHPRPASGHPHSPLTSPSVPSDATGPALTAPATAGSAPAQAEPEETEPTVAPSEVPDAVDSALDVASNAADEDDTDGMDAWTVGGIGAALAGGLLVFLGAGRARQHRHRKPGQRIALPTGGAAHTEDQLRRVQDPVTLDHVNRALRTLTARCALTGTELPAVRFLRLIHGQLELYLAEPAELLAPFVPTASRMLWVLDAEADILDADQAEDYPAPYPSLVSVGHDADGGLILVDLEHVGGLVVEGDAAGASEVMAAIAAELATSLWSDDTRVSTVGSLLELADVLDAGRIRHVEATDRQIGQLIDEMTARADADRAALADVDAASLGAARLAGVAEGTWAPEILLIVAPMSSAQRERLGDVLHARPRVAIAAVTSGGPPLSEWGIRLQPSDPDHGIIEPIGLGITPQRLSSQDYANLVGILATTGAEATAAAPTWYVDTSGEAGGTGVPAAAPTALDVQPGTTADGDVDTDEEVVRASRAPCVAVLGPVEILGAPELAEPSKRGQLTALAAYLALHPGQSREAVDEAMWPGRRVGLATRNTAMNKLRNWLGADPDGNDYVPRATPDGYRLHPDVRTDWHLFTGLLPDGPAKASIDDLMAALDLVHDQPFKGVNPRRYIWAERIQQEMIAAIGDVADELARRALRTGDHRLALAVIMVGLTVEPGSETLWRHRLRAHHAANDRAALEQAADHLTALADELGGDLEDETTELLTQLLSPTRQAAATTRRMP